MIKVWKLSANNKCPFPLDKLNHFESKETATLVVKILDALAKRDFKIFDIQWIIESIGVYDKNDVSSELRKFAIDNGLFLLNDEDLN